MAVQSFALSKHIDAETKWPPFATQCFEKHVIEWNVKISIKISLKFFPDVPFDNEPASVQIMAWYRPSAIIWTNIATGHRCIYASLGLSVL